MFLNSVTGLVTRALTKGQKRDVSISKEDLRTKVDIAGAEEAFQQGESYRIKGVFDFYHLNVKDVLKTPRVEMIALRCTAAYEVEKDVDIQNPSTRLPD